MPGIMVGTQGGLHGGEGERLDPRPVTALAAGSEGVWALLEDRVLAHWDGEWADVAALEEHRGRCLLAGGTLVGASDARVFRHEDGHLEQVAGFDGAQGREAWYTPWGGPPDTRSLTRDSGGTLYANVHVGGILRSNDGETWSPTALDIDADAHQVLAGDGEVLAATAYGLAVSSDGGARWTTHDDGLHAAYCRAVTRAGDLILVSASRGHHGREAALYRWDGGRFARCVTGLPEWFEDNIDSHCLAADGETVVAGTSDGRVFLSTDAGESWDETASGLPRVTSVAFTGRPSGSEHA